MLEWRLGRRARWQLRGNHRPSLLAKGVGYREECGRQVLFGDSDEQTLKKPVAPAYALEASPPGSSHGPLGVLVTAFSPRAPCVKPSAELQHL